MHENFMREALRLAARGTGKTRPNPMVGALVVRGTKIVGQGYHQSAGSAHAEIHALNEARHKAQGAVLYVNLEPCCFQGRTGPCTKAIIRAGIKTVVISMQDPNPRVAGKGKAELEAAGIEVIEGVLTAEAAALNHVFIKYMTGLPYITLKMALTLDGKSATVTGDSRWISSPESRRLVHALRRAADCVLTGIGTVLADDPRLTDRTDRAREYLPLRVLVDSQARVPLDAALLSGRSLVAVADSAPPQRLARLREAGVEIINCGNKQVDLVKLFGLLAAREVSSVLVEAGGTLSRSLFELDLVDRLLLFMAPKIIGGHSAPGLFSYKDDSMFTRGIDQMENSLNLKLIRVEQSGGDVLAEYETVRRK